MVQVQAAAQAPFGILAAGGAGRPAEDGGQRRLQLREEGLARGRAHNQELHELGHIRRHGGFQRDLPLA